MRKESLHKALFLAVMLILFLLPINADAGSTPNAFTFISQTGMPLSSEILSNPITVTGIDSVTGITIIGGDYRINNGTWTSSAGTVNSGDSVTTRQTSSSNYSTLTTATLIIGGVQGDFAVTTVASGDPGANGLVAWWRAENNPYDSIGGNHGVLNGNATYASGRTGQAFSLNGSGAYIGVLDSPSLALTESITIDGWFYASEIVHGSPIYNRRDASNQGGVSLQLFNCCGLASNTVVFYLSTAKGWISVQAPDDSVVTGSWYHAAATYDGSNMRLYLNGYVVASMALSGSIVYPNLPIVEIGHAPIDSTIYYFNGLIDEVQIYNRALSSVEVSKLAGTYPCSNPPSYNIGGMIISYSTIQQAYEAPSSTGTIEIQALVFAEGLLLDQNKTITLKGGYGCDFASNPEYTIVSDKLTVQYGTVTIENLIIQ